jgi:hypothetical protein
MPVIGVPLVITGSSATVSPKVTNLFGIAQLPKMRSVVLNQASAPSIVWTMFDEAGDVVDLTSVAEIEYSVTLAVRDGLATAGQVVTTQDGYITNLPGVDGKITATVPLDIIKTAGIYSAEIAILRDADGAIIMSNAFWLIAERSLFGDQTYRGPPTLAEVRLHLRDAPEGNRLLDEYEFDPAEIAAAITRCVDWFNEVEPPLQQRYTTITFPFRYHWMEGIVAELFTTAAHYYRRNKFNYSAGGIQVSSIDKEMEYMKAADYHRERWETWARKAKVRANMDDGFFTLGSAYSGRFWGQ